MMTDVRHDNRQPAMGDAEGGTVRLFVFPLPQQLPPFRFDRIRV